MEKSEQINELATALSKAQAEFKNILKDNKAKIRTKSGSEYSYSYADLASLLDMVREPLAKNGLCIVQGSNVVENTRLVVDTMILHSSGQFIKNSLSLPIVETGNNAIQAIGSSCTYGRRYELSSMLGIASEVDDDAAHVSNKQISQARNSDQSVEDHNENLKETFGPPITMMSILTTEAKKKFKTLDEFKAWRIDQGLTEDLNTLVGKDGKENGIEFAKIISALRGVK